MSEEMLAEEEARQAVIRRDTSERTRREIIVMLIIIALSFATVVRPDEPAVKITIYPKAQNFRYGGAVVRLAIAIQRDQRNRGYEVFFGCTSGVGERHHYSRQLEGEEASKYQPERMIYKLIPCTYTAVVRLHRNDGSKPIFRETAIVNGGTTEE